MKKDALKKYKAKRDFKKTPEPKSGELRRGKHPIFVIQKHDASNLHYDFRLEIEGVLKSWAVPKGPSLDPRKKRLAIETENHPLSYAKFEGVIPEGQYGAGPVMIWDRGTFKNLHDKSTQKSYQEGQLEIKLKGKKLKGDFALKIFRPKKKQWLLIKMKDDYADAKKNPVNTQTKSVKSGKTMAQIKKNKK